MDLKLSSNQLVELLRSTVLELLRREGPELTMRQLGVLLTCYLTESPQTVSGLAGALHLPKPAVSRILDQLGACDLTRRKRNPQDRRSMMVWRTKRGGAFMQEFDKITLGALELDTRTETDGPRPRGSLGSRKRHESSVPAYDRSRRAHLLTG